MTTVPSNEKRYLRKGLLDLRSVDDFLWLLRWLENAKHCDPADTRLHTRRCLALPNAVGARQSGEVSTQ